MKKIGILHGKERSFPEAFVERVNHKKAKGIIAEPVKIDKVVQGAASDYAVIIDRISQDVPFYRAFLKMPLSVERQLLITHSGSVPMKNSSTMPWLLKLEYPFLKLLFFLQENFLMTHQLSRFRILPIHWTGKESLNMLDFRHT